MECTLRDLDYLIRRTYTTYHNGAWHSSQVIRKVLIGESADSSPDVLCLVLHEENRRPRVSGSGLQLHMADIRFQDELQSEKGYFLFCSPERFREAVNHILSLFYAHLQWLHNVEHANLQAHSIQSLLALGAEYLNTDVSLINKSYELEYCQYHSSIHGWDERIDESRQMTVSALQELYIDNPVFDRTYQNKGLIPYPYPELPEHSLFYYNIFYHEDYLCRILVIAENKVSEPAFLNFMEYLCEHIADCYIHTYRQHAETDAFSSFRPFFLEVLNGKTFPEADMEKHLRRIGWGKSGRFMLLKLTAKGYGSSVPTLTYTCSQLESILSDCCAVQDGIFIYCAVNLSSPASIEQLETTLPVFLRENLFQAGISCIFKEFSSVRTYLKEADLALFLGQEKNPNSWIHNFSDCRLDYMLHQLQAEIPIRDLCHPAFTSLLSYDREHPGADLFETLHQYTLHMFNASDTARQLFIHRTTFFYRLRKIQELIPVDLESPDERLLLTISAKLLSQRDNVLETQN